MTGELSTSFYESSRKIFMRIHERSMPDGSVQSQHRMGRYPARRMLIRERSDSRTGVPMHPIREPLLLTVAVSELRPTQITIGMREVEERRKQLRTRKGKKEERFIGQHTIPVILGPKKRHYVIDHHHLARALQEEGIEKTFVTIVSNLSKLDQETFWVVLDNRGWMHPFDAKGHRCAYDGIPHDIRDLVDDPFRSLAGALRRAGGYAKETTPFSEFLWADFLRRKLNRASVEKDFKRALGDALRLAKSRQADYLPGWCGPVADE